jgi:hypothetical protein
MAIDISLYSRAGHFRFSYKRHVFVALGLLFVTSGLATLAGPWWQPLLEAALGKFGLIAAPSYQWLLGGTQIFVGLAFLAYKHFVLDLQQKKLEADRTLYQRAPLNFDRLRMYLTNLVDDHSYTSGLHTEFYEAWTRFTKPEDSFRLESTADRYKAFSVTAWALENFIGPHFFAFPNGQRAGADYRYCLAPHLNMDRELAFYDPVKMREYDTLKVQLHELVSATTSALNAFAEEIRNQGHV